MQDAKEEIRSRLNIEDVIGEYVQLKRAGRNFRGLSPFTGEKTPSFYVSPDKQIWHDFSSNKGGDVFSFVMQAEGIDFRQCLELLARKAGIDLAMYDSPKNQGLSKQKNRLKDLLELSSRYYQASLIKNKHAIDYVCRERGFSKSIISEFKIGYAPSSGDALLKFLISKGFNKTEINKAGLLNRFGSDLFRFRIMIPLMDASGVVIGYTARQLDNNPNSPKYLNSPQTLLYDKSRNVFGLSQAKDAIRKHDYAVIVEGNLDVISSHMADVKQVVATAGTAMTEYHLKAISRITKNIKLAFDGDRAGLAATERAISLAQNVEIELSVITLPSSAKDPDELIKQDPKLWLDAINNSEPAIDWVIKQYLDRFDITSASGKRDFTSSSLKLVRVIEDPVVSEHYLNLIAQQTNSSISALKSKLNQQEDDKVTSNQMRKVQSSKSIEKDEFFYHDNALAIGLIDAATRDVFKDANKDYFDEESRLAVLEYLQTSQERNIEKILEDLQKYDTYVKILLLKAETRYADWDNQDRYFETARLLRQIDIQYKQKQKDKLTEDLRDAETKGDEHSAEELRKRLHALIKEIKIGQRR